MLRPLAHLFLLALLLLAPAAPLLAQAIPAADPANSPTAPTQQELEEKTRQAQGEAIDLQREAIEKGREALDQAFEQFGNEAGAAAGAAAAGARVSMLISLVMGMVIFAVISAIFAVLIFLPYSKLPAEHQKLKPILVFLMVIPLFGYVWNFIMTAKVSDSFKSYSDAQGDTTVGDAGKSLGLWFAICAAVGFALTLTFILACLGFPVSIAALVLVILYIVKLWTMAGKIPDTATTATATA